MKKTTIPANATRIPLRPLALGEATGHAHRLVSSDAAIALDDACELYEFTDAAGKHTALRVTAEGISLIHAQLDSTETADHHPIAVAPGEYEVVIQEEETDWGRQQVID